MITVKKTLKREIAVGLLAGFGYVVYTGDHSMAEILVWPVFSFSALAFGMDWYGKVGISSGPIVGPERLQRQGSAVTTGR